MIKNTLKIALPLSVSLLMSTPSALAESTITVVSKFSTAWTQNYNPFTKNRLPSVRHFMFEPLVVYNTIKGGTPHWRLATGYKYSNDYTVVTYTLRKGVKWSDGKPFTADDVIFTYEMIKKHPTMDSSAVWKRYLDKVEKIDDYTVKFTMKKKNTLGHMDVQRTYVVPKHIWGGVADPTTFTNPNPVGSGPLTVMKRFTEQVYVQCRNPNYWDTTSLKVDCMKFPQLQNNDQTMIAAAKGELDWFSTFVPNIEKTYVAKDPKHHKYWLPGGPMTGLQLNFASADAGNKEAFNNLQFRRALSLSLDRDAIVDLATYGDAPVNKHASGLKAEYDAWRDKSVDKKFDIYMQYDPKKAKQILAKAGFKDTNGDGFIETPSGRPIAFKMIVPSGWTDWIDTTQIAIEGMRAVGVNVEMATPSFGTYNSDIKAQKYDMALMAWYNGETPLTMYDDFHTDAMYSGRSKSSGWTDPRVDALVDKFTTVSGDEQKKVMHELQAIFAENLPFIAIFNNPSFYEYNTKRFTGWFSKDNPVAKPDIGEGTPERLLHLLALKPR